MYSLLVMPLIKLHTRKTVTIVCETMTRQHSFQLLYLPCLSAHQTENEQIHMLQDMHQHRLRTTWLSLNSLSNPRTTAYMARKTLMIIAISLKGFQQMKLKFLVSHPPRLPLFPRYQQLFMNWSYVKPNALAQTIFKIQYYSSHRK